MHFDNFGQHYKHGIRFDIWRKWMGIGVWITRLAIETVSPEGTFRDTVQVPSSAGDMELN